MSKKIVDIGLNTCCYTRRWEEPDNWVRLSKEAGFDYIQVDSDALDPFFSGDLAYQLSTAQKLRGYAQAYGVKITGYYTGMASYRFHGLSHSDPAVRRRMMDWVIQSMDIAMALGAVRVGGRVDAYSAETLADPERYERTLKETLRLYRELSVIAREKGMEELEVEQMYVPSLAPYTIRQTYEYLEAMNKDNAGCRLGITVDIGHCASQNYGGAGADLLYEEWLKNFGAVCEEIHIQQTARNKSEHAPFTAAENAAGDVKVDRILEALSWSHKHSAELAWSKYLKPVEKNVLIVEYLPSTVDTEEAIVSNLKETADYLRNYIPKGGIAL